MESQGLIKEKGKAKTLKHSKRTRLHNPLDSNQRKILHLDLDQNTRGIHVSVHEKRAKMFKNSLSCNVKEKKKF